MGQARPLKRCQLRGNFYFKCQEDQNKGGFLFVQATASFIEVLDNMTSNVGESKNMLESLQTILNKLCSRLKSNEFNEKFRAF